MSEKDLFRNQVPKDFTSEVDERGCSTSIRSKNLQGDLIEEDGLHVRYRRQHVV